MLHHTKNVAQQMHDIAEHEEQLHLDCDFGFSTYLRVLRDIQYEFVGTPELVPNVCVGQHINLDRSQL